MSFGRGWRVIYSTGDVTIQMSRSQANDYAEMFDGRVVRNEIGLVKLALNGKGDLEPGSGRKADR